MKHTGTDPSAATDPANQLFLALAANVGILEQPKRAMRRLRDKALMRSFLSTAASECKGVHRISQQFHFLTLSAGSHVAVLEAGSGVIPCFCVVAGAASVTGAERYRCTHNVVKPADSIHPCTAYERNEIMARIARSTIAANETAMGGVRVAVKTMSDALKDPSAPAASVVVTGASF